MTNRINQLSALQEIQSGDQLPIYSIDNGDTRKVSINDLAAHIQEGFTSSPTAGGSAQDISDITGLQDALDGKEPSGTAAASIAAHEAASDPHPQYLQAADIAAKADLVAGKVPSAQLPSFVDDVLESANFAALPATGETEKIYVTLDTNKCYRWSGSAYVEISSSPGSTDVVTEGVTNKYFTESRVLATVLAGISFTTNAAITAADTVLTASGKLQKQITDALTAIAAKMTNPMTTAGDIVIGGASGAPSRLAASTDGYVLTLASGAPAWAAATGGSGGNFLSNMLTGDVSITGGTTLTATAFGKMHACFGTTADYTVFLPAVSGNAGKFIGFRMSDALTKFVTIDGNASETIDGTATRIMWAKEIAILYCDGATWTKVGGKSIPLMYEGVRTTAVSVPTVTATHIPINSVLVSSVGSMTNGSGYCSIVRPGKYMLTGMVSYEKAATSLAGYESYCIFGINSLTAFPSPAAAAAVPTYLGFGGYTYSHPALCVDRTLAAGDYVALLAYQSTGSTFTTRVVDVVYPHMSIVEIPTW